MSNTTAHDRASIFKQALSAAQADVDGELRAMPHNQPADNLVDATLDVVGAVGTGIAKAGFETKDALTTGFGMFPDNKPTYAQKSDFRKAIENDAAVYDRRSPINAVAGDISQFVTGMVGLSKVLAPVKALQGLGAGGKVALEVGKGAAVGATVFDPQEERLSNFIESYPDLHNPVTDFLAADPTDSDAEGRFKAALEGVGLDLALAGTFAAAVKVFKLVKAGAPEATVRAAEAELDKAVQAQQVLTGAAPANPISGALANKVTAEDEALRTAMDDPTAVDPLTRELNEGLANKPSLPGGPNVIDKAMIDGKPSTTTLVIDAAGKKIGEAAPQSPGEPVSITVIGGADEVQAAPAPKPVAPKNPVDVQTDDVNAIIQGWNTDAEAITTYGSREAAEEAGHRFGTAGQLPWQKLQGEGDLQVFTDQVAQTFKSEMDAIKGGDVLSDARVNFMVGQRAWLYGDDPAALMGMLRTAGKNANSMVANMEAGFLVANKAMADTYRLASQIRMGSLTDFGGDAVQAEAALRQRLRFAVEALGTSRAMTAAAGRSMRRMRGQFRVTPEQLAQLDSLDIDRLTSLIYESQGNPKKLAKMADPGFIDRALRGTGSIMANNLLWGWPSHVVNTVTSAYMSGIRPAERIVGSFVNGGGSAMRTRALREYRYMVSSLGDAWHFASQAFKSGDSVLAPHQTEWFTAASNTADGGTSRDAFGFVPMHTVGDLFKNAFTALDGSLRFPTRALGTVDEFIKQMSYRGYVQAEASIKADELGLKGADFTAYIEKALGEAFDEGYRATHKDALYEAQVRTFSQPLLGYSYGATLQNAVAAHPSLRAIFPFVRTPINVFRYTIKNLPILNLAQREYREMISGKMGPELQANAIGQMAMGSLALAVAGTLTADGKITGGGPKEPGLRQALEATGWKPYSFVRENGDGTHTYLPFNRFDPVGLIFGTAADITEIGLSSPDTPTDELALSLALAIAKNITDKTYLQNVNGFMRAAADPEASGGKWVGQIGESLIPYSSMLRQVNPDPYLREARTAVDNALDRMPGFSAQLPPLRDPFGYPMKVRTGLVFQDNADDIVDAEQQRLILETGSGIALPSGYRREGLDLRDMHLTIEGADRTAWDLLQEISIKPPGAKLTMKEAIAGEIASERYGMAPDGEGSVPGTKLFLLRRIVGKYREGAYKALIRQYPKEIGEPIARRALEAKEAWRQAQEGGQASASQVDQLRGFAAGYGVKLP